MKDKTILPLHEKKKMQLVKIHFKKLDLEQTISAKKPVYVEGDEIHVVASTKSFNNLLDEYKASEKTVVSTERKDFYLDKDALNEAVEDCVNSQIEKEEIASLVVKHIQKVLEGGCIYYKPITRK